MYVVLENVCSSFLESLIATGFELVPINLPSTALIIGSLPLNCLTNFTFLSTFHAMVISFYLSCPGILARFKADIYKQIYYRNRVRTRSFIEKVKNLPYD